SFRVITFSLDGSDLDSYADQVARALDHAREDGAIVCGISFGGLIAVRFASRYPSRCRALVLANTPKPSLTLRRRHQVYMKAPWLLGPLFLVETPFRVSGTLRAAVVLAHPLTTHGGTMHTKAVYQTAKALSRIGCAVLRFNFRGAGASAGAFDEGRGEMDDFRAALDFAADRFPGSPVWTA